MKGLGLWVCYAWGLYITFHNITSVIYTNHCITSSELVNFLSTFYRTIRVVVFFY